MMSNRTLGSPARSTAGKLPVLRSRGALIDIPVPTRSVPPSAAALVGSLRGVGYSLETAIADILDNSIAAGAKSIEIQWEWNDGEPVGWILDDGAGMDADRLVEAMRFGGIGPEAERTAEDLGRFGLGLKTASLSQCRQLAVVSKTSSGLASFTWDLDQLRKNGGGVGSDRRRCRPFWRNPRSTEIEKVRHARCVAQGRLRADKRSAEL